jgi:hypothetical protein
MCNQIKKWQQTTTVNDKVIFILTFLTLIVAVIGSAVAYWGLLPQLQELNAKGKIISAFTLVGNINTSTSTLSMHLEPLMLNVGYGDNCFDTDQWQVNIFFQDGVKVSNYDKTMWPISSSGTYEHDSTARILCTIYDPYGQHGSPDNIGSFYITIPQPTNKSERYFPLALFVSHGYKTPTVYIQAFFDYKMRNIEYNEVKLPNKLGPYDFSNTSKLVNLAN